MTATNPNDSQVFSLAALPCLPETRVRGFEFENTAFIGASAWLTSTSQWGCGYRCDGIVLGSPVGLDYARNRYYSSVAGRFNTPDPYRGSAKPHNPGSWNRYTYAGGDPINNNDPTGLYICTDGVYDDNDSEEDACEEDGGIDWQASNNEDTTCVGGCGLGSQVFSVTVTASSDDSVYCTTDPADPWCMPAATSGSAGTAASVGAGAATNTGSSRCGTAEINATAAALALDGAGTVLGFFGGEGLVSAAAQTVLSLASGTISASGGDGVGTVLGVIGAQLSILPPFSVGQGLKALPVIGAGFSVIGLINDFYSAFDILQSCP